MSNSNSSPTSPAMWGSAETKYFYELTPDRILDAVEAFGFRCTGRSIALNSMENRVYEVEIEVAQEAELKSPSERFRIVKFYRPGRWTREQIAEEHQFLLDLVELEIPVVAPVQFGDGETVLKVPGAEIWCAVFPKVGGRNPDELRTEQLPLVGRLLARLHACGAVREAPHRIELTPETYGRQSLQFLLERGALPSSLEKRYHNAVETICDVSEPLFAEATLQRIHGDCHLGNLLWGEYGPFWVDFDDMVRGPCVQDLWLIVPGRDDDARRQLDTLLDAYEQMRSFDYRSLRLIEPLRSLRMIHFSAWIAKRFDDPAFQRAFGDFGTERYWMEQVRHLEEQVEVIEQSLAHPQW
ncbi:MAG: serine/threonine protein kinase [Bdellovibrionales bacterium]|nr:serine/threonine protein kinase [Bdellovibrionales bacterium]